MSEDDLIYEITEMIAEAETEETKIALGFCRNRISKLLYDKNTEIERKDEAISFVFEHDDQMYGSSSEILSEALLGKDSDSLNYYKKMEGEDD